MWIDSPAHPVLIPSHKPCRNHMRVPIRSPSRWASACARAVTITFTHSLRNTPENRELTAEIMFETFNVKGLYIAVQVAGASSHLVFWVQCVS